MINRLSKQKTQANNTSQYFKQTQRYFIQYCIQVNYNCLHMIKNGQLNKSEEHLQKLMKCIKQLPQNDNARHLKRLALNTKAYQFERMKLFRNSLECLQDASKIQDNNYIEEAKNLLNQCTIQSRLGNHKDAIKMAKQSLQILRKRQSQQNIKTNYSEICQLVIMSFYNIGTQLINLKDSQQAQLIYRKGLDIALKHLGIHHELTLLMKKSFENVKKQNERDRNKHFYQSKASKIKMKSNYTKNYFTNSKSILSNRYNLPRIDSNDKYGSRYAYGAGSFNKNTKSTIDEKKKMNVSFIPQKSEKQFIMDVNRQRRSKTRLETNPSILTKDKNIKNKRAKSIEISDPHQTKPQQKKQGCEVM